MPVERTAFLEERTKGIGGSDIGSLLSGVFDVEYGCQRRLWLRLSGAKADYPDQETEPMTLGNILEPYVARAYSDLTGRRTEEHGLKKHAEHQSLQVHVDRIIYPVAGEAHTAPGALEIKAVGREMMRKIQDEGLPSDYIYQLNHAMLCHDLAWGAFAVGTREDLLPLVVIEQAAVLAGEPVGKLHRTPKIVHFDMTRSPEICGAIEEHGPRFWATLGDEALIPPRLEPEDPRCGRCGYRIQCQGAAVMEGVDPDARVVRRPDMGLMAEEYKIRKALLDDCEGLVADSHRKIRAAMGGLQAAAVPVVERGQTDWKTIHNRVRNGAERVDGRAMLPQYNWLRGNAIKAGLPGAELVQLGADFVKKGMPSRPLLLAGLLPVKPKSRGEVPETDDEFYG